MQRATVTLAQAVQLALHHHRAGEVQRAKEICQAILGAEPSNAAALNLLGVIASQHKQPDVALQFFIRAVKENDGAAEFHNNLGNAYKDLGQSSEAVRCYVDALRCDPVIPAIYQNLASALHGLKLPLFASFAEALSRRIAIRLNQGAWSRNVTDCVTASELVQFYFRLGTSFGQSRMPAIAYSCLKAALLWDPTSAALLNDCSVMLSQLGRDSEALQVAVMAVNHDPTLPEAYSTVGSSLAHLGRFSEAIQQHRRAISLGANSKHLSKIWLGLGYALASDGQLSEAIRAFKTSLAINPHDLDAHRNLGMVLLKGGDFIAGWKEYEWRLTDDDVPKNARRWRGEPLAGRSILICTEQGFGDSLQFYRYVIQLAERRDCEVTLLCQRPLVRLLAANTSATVIESVAKTDTYDYYIPIMSLALAFDTRLQTIPKRTPYIRPDPHRVERFRIRCAAHRKIKIGLTWATGQRKWDPELTRVHRQKSINFQLLERLLSVSHVTFFCLQKDEHVNQAQAAIAAGRLVDWSSELEDFADNAALIENLDLVISVDTAMAHLAAAMGKPTWILLPFNCEWRWLENRKDSPWYPSVKIFRQLRQGAWEPVIQAVLEDLVRED